jgi:uncharacterized membrane protein YbhN (UPF0104 family)
VRTGPWLLLAILLLVALPSLPWRRLLDQTRRTDLAWIGTALLANWLILPLWAAEWRLLVPSPLRVGFARMFEVVSITAAILNSIPFFVGEASGFALLVARAGLSRGAALSVLAMDQLLVGFAKLITLGAAAMFAPLPNWLRGGLLTLVVATAGLSLILLPLAHRWRSVRDHLLATPGTLRRFLARAAGWGEHFDALRDVDRASRVALLSLLKKAAELLAVLAVQLAFGIEPSLGGGLLVVAALSITTMVPLAPANLGVYEATVFACYRFLGLTADASLGIAIVQHFCFLVPPIATGALTLTLRPLLPRKLPV